MTETVKIELAPGAGITPLRVTSRNGEIIALRGETGRTQDEERVPLFGFQDGVVNLPFFIWSHYFSILLDVDGDSAELLLESPDGKAVVSVSDVSVAPTQVDVVRSLLQVSLPSDPPGVIASITPTQAEAGSRQIFELTFTVGPAGIAEGGGILLLTPVSAWSEPSGTPGSASVESQGCARLTLTLLPDAYRTRGPRIRVTVTDASLREGDVIRLRYSEEDQGISVQTYISPCVYFRVLVDEAGHGNYTPIPLLETPRVEIVPGPARRLRLASPSIVHVGERFDARLVVLDDCFNPVGEGYSGECSLSCGDSSLARGHIQPVNGGSLELKALRLETPGLHILRAQAGGLADAHLPVLVTSGPPDQRIYWGAIHGHSNVSDGEGTPNAYYTYGRDVGLVDVCSLTDHAWEIALHHRNAAMGRFAGIVDAARRYHEDGRFVTIPAYEWMGPEGHVNIYYFEDDPEAPVFVDAILEDVECPSLDQLLDRYRGKNVLVLPHASHGMRWEHFDPRLEPVVEMVSMWGSAEFQCCNPEGVNTGLQRGYRFGFIGGSDGHHGCPGQTGRLSRYKMLNAREGLAAFRARSLNRKSIFDAIRARNTYATTGERIYLDFSINGIPMGGELRVRPGADFVFQCQVGGTASLATIECIRNGTPEPVQRFECSGFIAEHSWTARSPETHGSADYYYLRVTQQNGEMAWSSPIWVDGEWR